MKISYGFKPKTGTNAFGEEVKFATTTDLIKESKDSNITLKDIIEEIKENKSIFAVYSGEFSHDDWNDTKHFTAADSNNIKRFTFEGGQAGTTAYLLPLDGDLTDCQYPYTGSTSQHSPELTEIKANKYFEFSQKGGIRCLRGGYIEISASMYFYGVSNTRAGIYIVKNPSHNNGNNNSDNINLKTGFVDLQDADLHEVFSTRANTDVAGTQSTGRRFLKIEEGDIFYLAIVPSSSTVDCAANHCQTGLFINYISLD